MPIWSVFRLPGKTAWKAVISSRWTSRRSRRLGENLSGQAEPPVVVISYSAKARQDLLELWRWYAAKGGLELADSLVDRIQQRIAPLERHPEIGSPRPDIALSARVLVVHRWLVLYEFINGRVRIIRIVDGAIDPKRLVRKD
jgi:toxin ParE1/3/4